MPLWNLSDRFYIDQVYSNTQVPTRINTKQHESNMSQHKSDTSQHGSDTSQHELTRVKTNQHESDTSQHESTQVQNRSRPWKREKHG